MAMKHTHSDSIAPLRDQSAIRNLKSEIWLHRFAMMLVVATFILLGLGGTVTSKGVGLSVPDWPTTYDYNMFLFPPSLWVGGVFWEHTHRLMGSVVGILTIAAAIWLWLTQKHRPWLRWLGAFALLLVIVQGVMGGLRVTKDPTHPNLALVFAIAHGVTAQLFLCVTVLIAAATGKVWHEAITPRRDHQRSLGYVPLVLLIVMVVQLSLGAAMRHTNAGLAIPDFPTSYGRVIPPLSQDAIIDATNAQAGDDMFLDDYASPAQVAIHFAHRAWAVLVVLTVIWSLWKLAPLIGEVAAVQRPAMWLLAMLVAQLALGAAVIWTRRHPEIATAHQMLGAALLATTAWLAIRVRLFDGTITPRQIESQSQSIAMSGARA
jgi:cytochrome c oxidase assembly protein subunit 15